MDIIRTGQVISHTIKDDGVFPNNGILPLLVYQGALSLPGRDPAAAIEDLFEANQWGNSWRNGVYGFHHYHSTAHEVLAIYSGKARVQLGGENGVVVSAERGDVIIIPAGMAHKNLGSSSDFACVGAYPFGQRPDMNYGKERERPQVDQNIASVPLPRGDPVYGMNGPLGDQWPGMV
ncbi:cupin domain-containing protein [Chloroflexota bacterium]